MELIVPLDRPTATEAIAVARSLAGTGVAFGVGPGLLARGGGAVASAVRALGSVFVDARLSGERSGVVAAARHLAASGANWVSVDGRLGADTVAAVADALRPHACRTVVVAVPPDGDDDAIEASTARAGRGRAVSLVAAGLAALDVDVMGRMSDAGVVAQAAPSLGVVIAGLRDAGDVAEAVRRGAAAGLIDATAIDDRDPVRSVSPLVEAVTGG